jgi:hypothetical protein
MAWLPVNIAMILGHQDLTLGEGWRHVAVTLKPPPVVRGPLTSSIAVRQFKSGG